MMAQVQSNGGWLRPLSAQLCKHPEEPSLEDGTEAVSCICCLSWEETGQPLSTAAHWAWMLQRVLVGAQVHFVLSLPLPQCPCPSGMDAPRPLIKTSRWVPIRQEGGDCGPGHSHPGSEGVLVCQMCCPGHLCMPALCSQPTSLTLLPRGPGYHVCSKSQSPIERVGVISPLPSSCASVEEEGKKVESCSVLPASEASAPLPLPDSQAAASPAFPSSLHPVP
jgi:hypothetical protein